MSDKSPRGDTPAEQACVDIYMAIHVSEMKPLCVESAWLVGQKIYNSRKKAQEID